MKQKPNTSLSPYNLVVKQAYLTILKATKLLLSQIERDELRYSLVRDEGSRTADGIIIHEFVSPLLYLRLECGSDNVYAIHYGFEGVSNNMQLSSITSMFTRSIYKLTSKEQTAIDIELAVKTDWLIETPSVMYEYLEERNKYHVFQLIKYKVTASQRKRLLSVA